MTRSLRLEVVSELSDLLYVPKTRFISVQHTIQVERF